MADAYSVMAQAKRQGAELNAIEKYNQYIKDIQAEEARASKAGFLGKLGGGIFGSIASLLAPAALTALGIGTGGLGFAAGLGKSMLTGSLAGAGITRGATELGDFLARQWEMGGKRRGKKMKDVKGMGALSGPYGQRLFSELQQKGKTAFDTSKQTISDLLDVETMNRNLSSILSGLTSAGKAKSAFASLGEDATLGEKMMAGITGDAASGWKMGAKDTADWMKFGGRVMNPIELSEQAELFGSGDYVDILKSLSNQAPWTGYKPSYASGGGGYRPSYYDETSLLDSLIAMQEPRGRIK